MRRSTARRRILNALDAGPMTGYELAKAIRIRPSTAVYPHLYLMEVDGLIDSEWAPGPPPRLRLYRLAGR